MFGLPLYAAGVFRREGKGVQIFPRCLLTLVSSPAWIYTVGSTYPGGFMTLVHRVPSEHRGGMAATPEELTVGFYLWYCLFNVCYGKYIGFRFMV